MGISTPNVRQTNLILFVGCMGLIAIALILQHIVELKPCALCITQRIFVILVGVIALVAFFHNPQGLGLRIYAALGAVFAIIGGGFSSRHLWLQNLPEGQGPACGPGLQYLLENFPLMDALDLLLRGDGNCADVVWSLLGISIPGWTLLAFIGLLCINLWQIFRV